jgi:hypothetical protein
VSGSGLAVLQGSRWEALGITLEVETGTPAPATNTATSNTAAQAPVIGLSSKPVRRGRRTSEPDRAIVAVTVELKNHGEKPLAIWTPGDSRAFRLVPQKNWSDSLCRWVGDGIAPAKPEAGEIVILKSGESRKVRIDLTAPAWALRYRDNEKAEELATTVPGLEELEVPEWSFRIEYAPPPAADCAGLPGANYSGRGVCGRARSRRRRFVATESRQSALGSPRAGEAAERCVARHRSVTFSAERGLPGRHQNMPLRNRDCRCHRTPCCSLPVASGNQPPRD